MKTSATSGLWWKLGGLALLGLAGCGDKNGNGTPDVQLPTANQVAKSVDNAASTVKKEAGPAVAHAANAVEKGAQTIKKEAGPAVAKGVQALDKAAKPVVASAEDLAVATKVKTAIIANQTVDSSQINVDAYAAKSEVVLRGRVKNSNQKALLQQIAKKQEPNYKVVNQLQIKG